jgi:hypothetical protein
MSDKTSTEDGSKNPESEGDGLITLFSSDNTELTDFTERVKKAILGDDHQEQEVDAQTEQPQNKKGSKPKLVTIAKNNVVNLFGPK